MKKSLIAMAVLAASGTAMAQSSVTLFGIVDAAVTRIVNKNGLSNTGMSNSAYNTSRLGFRGTEDLGGGMSASFWLEGALANDEGTAGAANAGTGLNFLRRSTVSLSGPFGEVRLGRDYVPSFWNDTVFDPFGTLGVGTSLMQAFSNASTANGGSGMATSVRASNSIGYFLPPNLGGFYGQAMYAFSETASNIPGDPGRYIGARVGYSAGPLNVAVGLGRQDGADTATPAAPDYRVANIGASWNFGFLNLMGEVSRLNRDGNTTASDIDYDGYLLGLTAPVGPGQVRFAWSRVKVDLAAGADPRASKLALGYVYNLSKRTAVYATVARVSNKNGSVVPVTANAISAGLASPGQRSSGYDIGLRHSF